MRKILYLFIYIASFAVLCACGGKKSQNSNTIYVSIAPLKPIVEGIVGDDYAIEVLVPAGASPETFEPTAKQFIALNEAKIIFGTGLLDFEKSLLARIHDQSKVVNLSNGIETIAGSCSHTHHGRHCHHGVDPHIWCSPKSIKIMAQNAYAAICATISGKKYRDSYAALNEKIAELDSDVEAMCSSAALPYFIIYHPALTYLARDYNLEQVAIENEGKEPSAKRIAEIIERGRRSGVKRVFYQSEFPQSSVGVVAEDIGAEAVEINPLGENIFENLRHITALITE